MSKAPVINTHEEVDTPDNQYKALAGLGFILVSPITVLAAALVYMVFSYGRIKRSVISLLALPLFIIPCFFIEKAWNDFISSWLKTFPQIFKAEEKAPVVMEMLAQQFWIAFPIGILLGLGIASWRWYNRARWQTLKFRRTPWEIFNTKKTIQKIRNDEDTPSDGMTLGIDKETGKRVVQTFKESGGHTFLVGGSGAGKTRTALSRIRDQIKNGDGVCIIDLKADPEVVNIAKIYADRYGKKLQHFTLQDVLQPYEGPAEDGPAHYDPLAQGDNTRRADMVLDLRDWTNAEFYKKLTQSYLQQLFTVHINNPPKENISTLEDAIALMSPKYLQERSRPLANDPRFSSIVASIDAMNDERMSSSVRENLQTNRGQLETFFQGVAGPWLTYDKGGNNISIIDSVMNGDIIVFSLDSQAYGTLAANIANLIIQDLKTVSSELLKIKNEKRYHVFIDEFSAIGSENIIGLLNKARASEMHITIATQTLGDLMAQGSALRMQLMGIISSFIIHRANTEEDAKVYAGLTGTTLRTKVRHTVGYSQSIFGGIGKGIGTGGGSVEEVEEWKVMPNKIQALSQGELYYINTSEHRINNVKCIIEDIADPTKGGTANADLNNSSQHNSLEKPDILSLEKTESVPTLAELSGTESKRTASSPIEVNPQLNTDSLNNDTQPEQKESPQMLNKLFGKKESKEQSAPKSKEGTVSTKQAFDEVKDMEKVEINYDLLRTFFNDPAIVNEQEQEDIADGVASAQPTTRVAETSAPVQQMPTQRPPTANPSASSTPSPVKSSPFTPKPSNGAIPTTAPRPSFPMSRPQPKKSAPPAKSEFDF